MDAQPMMIPVDAAPCGQVRPFIDFLAERFASQPEGDLKLSAQARSAIRDSRPGHAWSRLGKIPRSRVLHPCYRAARRLSAFDGQRATFEGAAVLGCTKRTSASLTPYSRMLPVSKMLGG